MVQLAPIGAAKNAYRFEVLKLRIVNLPILSQYKHRKTLTIDVFCAGADYAHPFASAHNKPLRDQITVRN
jgi:hypothetical protein